MSAVTAGEQARRRAACVWSERRRFELDAALRFDRLARELRAAAASATVIELAEAAARDELRHAELCATLSRHFGAAPPPAEPQPVKPVAPRDLDRKNALLYEIVALACVTETLSTALLGALVERATDSLARRAMHSILRDEVKHSRLGWAYLAEAASAPALQAVSQKLPELLSATLSEELFRASSADPEQAALAGLGQLERSERRRIVCGTLEAVVFPGLERFGADVRAGKRWLETCVLRARRN